MENSLDKFNSRSEIQEKELGNLKKYQQKGSDMKNKQIFKILDKWNLRYLWYNIRNSNRHIIGTPEGDKRKRKKYKRYQTAESRR